MFIYIHILSYYYDYIFKLFFLANNDYLKKITDIDRHDAFEWYSNFFIYSDDMLCSKFENFNNKNVDI